MLCRCNEHCLPQLLSCRSDLHITRIEVQVSFIIVGNTASSKDSLETCICYVVVMSIAYLSYFLADQIGTLPGSKSKFPLLSSGIPRAVKTPSKLVYATSL